MESRIKHPGTVLPVPPRATAVSIRHKGAGPTHCTKSSIFRTVDPPPENPSTAIAPLGCKEEEKPKKKYNPRITKMDLAIGWDIKENGHGHTGPAGAAPSVFNIVPLTCHSAGDCGMPGGCGTPSANGSVKSPLQQKSNHIEDAPCSSKQNTPPDTKPSSALNSKPTTPPLSKPPSSQSSKQSRSKNSKPPSASKPSTAPHESYNQNRKNGSLRSWEKFGRPPVRKAWEEKENDSPNTIVELQNQFRGDEIKTCMPNGMESLPKVNNVRKRRSQSSPNLSRNAVQPQFQRSNPGTNHKACSACHDESKNKTNASPKTSESSAYKMAFKAGKLGNNRPMTAHPSGSGSTSSSQQDLKVKIPKPRPPFARRSYSISTLAPPFSLWPGNHKRGGRDYPDHWRLASVYQHAFKPVQNRTRPLLATVYQ
ncbi:hypothetical protein J437_LFUL009685 [Ladona fulva]|uniref:DUF4812 domain-containing protein n=1 Tax=Ladona fulva TaxID=123851 RepID=A0A8K0NYR3_LADFU|nr:hypothetical protein J437_LFUL009685 [Ladona fulva]